MKSYLAILLTTLLLGCAADAVRGEIDSERGSVELEQANWERYVASAREYYRKGRPHLAVIAEVLASVEVNEIRIGDPSLHVQWKADGGWSSASDELQERLFLPFQELAVFAASSAAGEIQLLALPAAHFHPSREVSTTFYRAGSADRDSCIPAEMAKTNTGACALALEDGWFLDVVW